MKRSTIVLLSILGVFLLVGFNGCNAYNAMVQKEEGVTAAWKQVGVAYQARLDKTKNLFEIVQGASDFESKTLKEVMQARAAATQIRLDAEDLSPEKLEAFQKAQDNFGRSLGRLIAVAENYPQLQAVGAWRDFQAQYEGMENRISTARTRFNEITQDYNTYIRRFPRKIWAGMFGFERKGYFEAQAGAENAPDIKGMREEASQ